MNDNELKEGIIKAHNVLKQSHIVDASGLRALEILTDLITKISEEDIKENND